MTSFSSKTEPYDAAVCVLREASATTVEECVHDVGGTIAECKRNKGPVLGVEEYSLAVVDKAEAAMESIQQCGPDIVALVSESCTLKLAGPLLDHIPHQDIIKLCYTISNDMDISIDTKNSCLTLKGYWGHIQKAREGIHMLFLRKVQEGCLEPGYEDTPKTQYNKPVKSSSSFAGLESHYEMLSDLSPDILSVMRSKQSEFKPGISHTPGSTVVHFTFSSPEDLCHAVSTFEQDYESLSQQLCHEYIQVPQGISDQDDLTLEKFSIESRYRDTCLTWVPENHEIKILCPTDQLPSVREELRSLFETLEFKRSATSPKSTGGKDKSPMPEVNYRDAKKKQLEANIPLKSAVVLSIRANHKIIVQNGNILQLSVDAIVNPANSRLSHGGGLAAQVDKASRGEVQQLSRVLLSNKNSTGIEPGLAVHTGAGGNLKCKYVIHAVGPNAHEIQDEEVCKKLLRKTCLSALEVAKDLGINSIAFPAISSGLYGMNKEIVAEVIIDTLVTYKQDNCTGTVLQTIHVIILDKETYYHFQRYAMVVQSSLGEGTVV